MIFKGTLVGTASGSISGVTFSRNRGGQYTRLRAIPANPNTVQQEAVRSITGGLSNAWVSELTANQRAGWDAYANAVQLPNALGDLRNIGGIGAYVRANTPRIQAALARVDTAPAIFGGTTLTQPGITSITAGTSVMVITFTNTDEWAGEVGGALLVYTSRPQNPSVNSVRSGFRFAGKVSGAVSPPASPQNITIAFPVVAGQRVFVRFAAVTADGRRSADFITFRTSV